MSKQKSEVDLGKGFKRIFYVATSIWFIFIMVLTAAERSECIPSDGWVTPPFCNDATDTGAFMYSFILWIGSTVIAYFFFKWIVLGFKKK